MRAFLLAATCLTFALAQPALAQDAAADPATVKALAPVPAGRLSDFARPLAYRLDLSVDPAQQTFSGHVEIDVQLKAPSAFVDLHGRDLKVSSAVARFAGRTLAGRWHQIDPSGVARLVFDQPLPAGPVTLVFDYVAPFNKGPSGMFHVKVDEDWYSWTQFELIDARAAFPGFDEPGFKVPFTVTLRSRPGQMAVSNSPEISTIQEQGWEVHRFAPTLPLPTYLVAMMVGPFAKVEGTVAPTPQRASPLPVRIVTTRQNAGQIKFALEGTKGIVALLERYFDQPFPYPKLDQITTPILPGAMENAGADLYADPILVLDDAASTDQKRTFGMVVAHELSHQWFGDLVTPAWWDDIWLNESFANWMGYRIGDEWRRDLNIRSGALAEGFGAMNTDSLIAGRAIHQPIPTNAQVDEAFDSITYGKGGHVVAMIAGFMGDDRFRQGVRGYMARHRYGNATSTDFFKAMADASGDPRIVPAMQSFTDQQGVPLVTFTSEGDGRYRATQSRYVRLGTNPPEVLWGIPLCLRRDGLDKQCLLLTERSASITPGGAGALIPNAGGTGYYRFELPSKDWDALIAIADKLPGGEAQALDDSLYASFLAGRASPAQLIASARNLARNPDSYASEAGMESLAAFQVAGMLDPKGEKGYRRLVNEVYLPRLAVLGFDPRGGAYAAEDPEVSQKRMQVVAKLVEAGRNRQLRMAIGAATRAYLKGDKAALDPSWYGLGLSILLDEGGLKAARDLAERGLASQDALFRPYALGALGSTGNVKIARWALDEFSDKRLRPSERLDIVRSVVRSRGTRELGFAWIKGHFDELTSGSGGIFFAARMPGMLAGHCSAGRADEIAALLRPRLSGRTGGLELERTIERVRACGILKQNRAAELSQEMARIR